MATQPLSHNVDPKCAELFDMLALEGRRTKRATLEMMILAFEAIPAPLRDRLLSRQAGVATDTLVEIGAVLDHHVASKETEEQKRTRGRIASAKGG